MKYSTNYPTRLACLVGFLYLASCSGEAKQATTPGASLTVDVALPVGGSVGSGGAASCDGGEAGAGCLSGSIDHAAPVTRHEACPDADQGGPLIVATIEPPPVACIAHACWEECDPCAEFGANGGDCAPPTSGHYRCNNVGVCASAEE